MTQSETIHGKFKSYHSNSPRTGSAVEEDKKHIHCLCHSTSTDTLYGSLFTLPLRLTCSQLMSVPIPSKKSRRIIIICTASFQENRETATLPQIHDNIILSGNHHHHRRLSTPPQPMLIQSHHGRVESSSPLGPVPSATTTTPAGDGYGGTTTTHTQSTGNVPVLCQRYTDWDSISPVVLVLSSRAKAPSNGAASASTLGYCS